MRMYGFGIGEFVITRNDFVAIFSTYPAFKVGYKMQSFTEYSETLLRSILKEPNTPEKQIINFFGGVEGFKKSNITDTNFFREKFPEFFL